MSDALCGKAEPRSQAEKDAEELHLMKTCGIVELSARNPNVSDWIDHWEQRALSAEAAKAAAHAAGVAEGMERARKIAVGQLKNTWPDLTEREMGALNVLLAICAAIPKTEGAE